MHAVQDYPSLGSDVTAVSRLDKRVDEAGFKTSSQAYGSDWENAPISMNTSLVQVPVPILIHPLMGHPLFQGVEMSEIFIPGQAGYVFE